MVPNTKDPEEAFAVALATNLPVVKVGGRVLLNGTVFVYHATK